MLWGQLNKHWFIKRFVLVYITGLIVAGFGFSANTSAVTISQTTKDTRAPGGWNQSLGTGISGTFTSITMSIDVASNGTVFGDIEECTDATYAVCAGVEALSASYTGSGSQQEVTFTSAGGLTFDPTKYYIWGHDHFPDAGAYYGSTNSASYPDGICFGGPYAENCSGGVKDLYFVLTLSDTILPHITAISPTSGPVGTLVTITGSNFGSQGASTVNFGATAASISSWSDTQIKATAPSLAAGTYDVVVTTSAGSSNLVSFQIISSGPSITVSSALNRVWANGHEKTEIIVSVLNAQGQGVAGRRIRLSANPATGATITETSTGSAVTDSLGQAHFIAKSTKIGPVVFTATDAGNPALVASAQVEFIQRKVIIFVQGIKTELNDTTATEDRIFPAIRRHLIWLGFSRPPKGTPETERQCANSLIDINRADDDGDGVPNDGCPLILAYSYNGVVVSNTTGIAFPQPYTCDKTAQQILISIARLTRLMRDFADNNPNTRFILIGHSQGGLIALHGARLMSSSVPIDALITLDGALGGAPRLEATTTGLLTCWGPPASTDMIALWNLATDHTQQGSTVSFLGITDNRSIVTSLRSSPTKTKVVTIGSHNDGVWNPGACRLPGRDNRTTQIINNADVAILRNLGGNGDVPAKCSTVVADCGFPFSPTSPAICTECLPKVVQCLTNSHSAVHDNPTTEILDIIQKAVGNPTEP